MDTYSLEFLGRFHPLIVHLPIGFLILALLFQIAERMVHKEISILDHAIRYALLLGAITALLSATSGWILADYSRFDSDTLDWHRWAGVGVMVVSFIAWILKTRKFNVRPYLYNTSLVLLSVLLVTTGHWGGSLTHGDEYFLELAPAFIRNILITPSDSTRAITLPDNPDSVVVYTDLIQPILEAKCYKCHNSDEKSGHLDMTMVQAMMEGGDEGQTIVRGNAHESGLFQRVTLPIDHSKFMPPRGDPLTYSEIRIVEWWINQGASFEGKLSSMEIPDDLSALLLQNYGIDLRPLPFFETTMAQQVTQDILNKIRENGFQGGEISEQNHYLRLKAIGDIIDSDEFKSLISAREQIVFLDLSDMDLSDINLEWVGQLDNLYNLDLSNTSITDAGLIHLQNLSQLSILNLYGTNITDQGLNFIRSLPELKTIFLWQTKASEAFITKWGKDRPELEIVSGE